MNIPGKVYGRVITERIQSNKTAGSQMNKEALDQVFTMKYISKQ